DIALRASGRTATACPSSTSTSSPQSAWQKRQKVRCVSLIGASGPAVYPGSPLQTQVARGSGLDAHARGFPAGNSDHAHAVGTGRDLDEVAADRARGHHALAVQHLEGGAHGRVDGGAELRSVLRIEVGAVPGPRPGLEGLLESHLVDREAHDVDAHIGA